MYIYGMTKTIRQIEYESNRSKYDYEIYKLTKENLERNNKMLKDYPYTKWMARLSFIISAALALLTLIQYLKT